MPNATAFPSGAV